MKRRLTVVNDSFQPQRRLVPAPEPRFWQALLAVRNRYFGIALDQYCHADSKLRDGHIYRDFQVLDYWIDMAIARGWIDEDESVN